ncbi:MAG: hypothetical protein AB4372_40465 [Xenococcus sp. (in: cyanobacteria)]
MLKAKLDFCASLLYHWLRMHSETNKVLAFNIENFQIWTSEFLSKKLSREEIQAALLELQNFDLITINDSCITLCDRRNKFQPQIESLPTHRLNRNKNYHPWLGAIILVSCLIGFGMGSIFLPNGITQQNTGNTENIER